MTPDEFDRLAWDDYHRMREYQQRVQSETRGLIERLPGGRA